MITDAEILANRKVWTGAMRSGHYIKGRSRMRGGVKYCCLGVLCATGVVPGHWEEDSDNTYIWMCPSGLPRRERLSPLQRAAVGLSTDEQEKLLRMNDGGYYSTGMQVPFTFAQIADYIDSLPIERDTP